MVKIAVIGGGINGVTCALKIKEKHRDFDVVLISKEFSPNTTGDGSGGLWYPYLCGNTPGHLLAKWGGETFTYVHSLWLEGGLNISVMPVYALYREDPEPTPVWAPLVFGFQNLSVKELEYLSRLYSVDYVGGHTFTTFIVQPPRIISHLQTKFLSLGGRVIMAEVMSLRSSELSGYDVVINCTGLGARDMAGDKDVFPIRGQIFKTIAPWINCTLLDQTSCHYIIPNADTCVLGGTHQEYNFDKQLNDVDTDHILNGCVKMVPGLQNAPIINSWVGLRPGRDEIRIQAEVEAGRLYIHNYGHGGSGLTLFWGCGTEVLHLLENYLKNNSQIPKSKL